MANDFLNRDDAPFSAKVWETIDAAVIGAAKSQLSARKLFQIEGPYGAGLKLLPRQDNPVQEEGVEGVALLNSDDLPLPMMQSEFCLGARDIAAFEQHGVALDLGAAAAAAIAVARQEDALLFNGSKALRVEGLLNAKGILSSDLKSWSSVGAAVDGVVAAANKLDAAGFHGPYALALTPGLYNMLFRLYPQTGVTELEHLKQIAADGVIKAPGIAAGGVLLATGKQFATIVLGQDITAGFTGPKGRAYEFTVSSSVALRLLEPASVCALKPARG
jgi:uncharacterized linocin/CFP29 family protein